MKCLYHKCPRITVMFPGISHVFLHCFQFQNNKFVNSGDEKRTTALQESIVNVACPIPEGDQDDMPWHFSLSVSNNGVQKSKPFMMTVFHSKCNLCTKSGECKPQIVKVRKSKAPMSQLVNEMA